MRKYRTSFLFRLLNFTLELLLSDETDVELVVTVSVAVGMGEAVTYIDIEQISQIDRYYIDITDIRTNTSTIT
jgi:hypothetical protein